MKNRALYKITAAGLVMAALCLAWFSCQKGNETPEPETLQTNEKSVGADLLSGLYKNIGGTLWFQSMKVADSICQVLNRLPRPEFEAWEQKMGFLSQKTVYHNYLQKVANAKTKEEFENILEKYADLNKMEGDMVKPDFSAWYSPICNREGIFYAGDFLVGTGRDYRLMLRDGKKEDLALYKDEPESFHTRDVYFSKLKRASKLQVPVETGDSRLKTGQYCGYGFYGPEIEWVCIKDASLDKRIEFTVYIGKFVEELGDPCETWHTYYYSMLAEAYRKYFGKWHTYSTDISLKNCKFKAVYPDQIQYAEWCETCPGYQAVCYDWDCITEEFFINDMTKEGDWNFGYLKYLGAGVVNPISPNTIPDTPYFIKVHAEATHSGMEGIHSVISYGYGGTQGRYCEQR